MKLGVISTTTGLTASQRSSLRLLIGYYKTALLDDPMSHRVFVVVDGDGDDEVITEFIEAGLGDHVAAIEVHMDRSVPHGVVSYAQMQRDEAFRLVMSQDNVWAFPTHFDSDDQVFTACIERLKGGHPTDIIGTVNGGG